MSGRTTATWTVTIGRSPAEVFDYLSDVRKHAEWSPKPYRVEGVTAPLATGDTFTSIGTIPGDKNHRNDVTVTESSAPTRLVLDAMEKGEHFISTFDLSAVDGGTLVTRTMDAPTPRPPLSLVFPLIMKAFIRPDVQKGLNKLKSNLEQS
jgi:uncharacterized protein YndB with AHSA1/START domain